MPASVRSFFPESIHRASSEALLIGETRNLAAEDLLVDAGPLIAVIATDSTIGREFRGAVDRRAATLALVCRSAGRLLCQDIQSFLRRSASVACSPISINVFTLRRNSVVMPKATKPNTTITPTKMITKIVKSVLNVTKNQPASMESGYSRGRIIVAFARQVIGVQELIFSAFFLSSHRCSIHTPVNSITFPAFAIGGRIDGHSRPHWRTSLMPMRQRRCLGQGIPYRIPTAKTSISTARTIHPTTSPTMTLPGPSSVL